jgi:hypothetical protein
VGDVNVDVLGSCARETERNLEEARRSGHVTAGNGARARTRLGTCWEHPSATVSNGAKSHRAGISIAGGFVSHPSPPPTCPILANAVRAAVSPLPFLVRARSLYARRSACTRGFVSGITGREPGRSVRDRLARSACLFRGSTGDTRRALGLAEFAAQKADASPYVLPSIMGVGRKGRSARSG